MDYGPVAAHVRYALEMHVRNGNEDAPSSKHARYV